MAKKISLLLFAAAAAAVIISGCTERERMGYSAIPQNAPASWEMSPFSGMAN